jgi:hypothetical protein
MTVSWGTLPCHACLSEVDVPPARHVDPVWPFAFRIVWQDRVGCLLPIGALDIPDVIRFIRSS